MGIQSVSFSLTLRVTNPVSQNTATKRFVRPLPSGTAAIHVAMGLSPMIRAFLPTFLRGQARNVEKMVWDAQQFDYNLLPPPILERIWIPELLVARRPFSPRAHGFQWKLFRRSTTANITAGHDRALWRSSAPDEAALGGHRSDPAAAHFPPDRARESGAV